MFSGVDVNKKACRIYVLTSIVMEKVAHLLLHQHEENTASDNYPLLSSIILELQQTCLYFGKSVWNFYLQIEYIQE